MNRSPRPTRSTVTIGRPAHVPKAIVVDDPTKIRRLLARALHEREGTLRVKHESTMLSLRVLEAEFRGNAVALTWQNAFADAQEAPLASPPEGANCTWLVLAGGRGALGFQATVLEAGIGQARLEIPDKIVYKQKREEIRYRIPGGYEMHAHLSVGPRHPPVAGRIYDLSAGGISVLVPADQAQITARRVSFRLHGRLISAAVSPISPPPKESGSPVTRLRAVQRLRFRFVELADADQDLIRLFVVDHLVSRDVDSEV